MKHYYRYLRPGAVRIGATYTADEYLLVNAFVHGGNDKMTIVAVNNATASRQIQLTGAGLPSQMQMYLTTSTGGNKLCADQGSVATASAITLPAQSVVTLDADYVVGVRPRAAGAAPAGRAAHLTGATGRAFLMDGSAVRYGAAARAIHVVENAGTAAVTVAPGMLKR
jgi:hypothetical protein